MADNVVLNSGTGGPTIRTIDRTGIETQVINLDFGGETGPESLEIGRASCRERV